MGMGRNSMDALVLAGGSLSGAAKPAPISERAPLGRLFAAISTLADTPAAAGEMPTAPDRLPRR